MYVYWLDRLFTVTISAFIKFLKSEHCFCPIITYNHVPLKGGSDASGY